MTTPTRPTSQQDSASSYRGPVKAPARTDTTIAAGLPESFRYRLKRLLLGAPLVSEDLSRQRLGKPSALAVLSSDVMSSSAYASEQILRVLVPVVGVAAFSLVTPITLVILAVLAVVTACYREVVKSYPKAGGSYVVSRDNFGPNVAQIAGAALLISYTITVAVSVAAGTDAIISAVPALSGLDVPLSVVFVLLIAFGNLRGIREAGRVFAVPTYFFIFNMAVLIAVGLARAAIGNLPQHQVHTAGAVSVGQAGTGLLFGASIFIALRAFANGASAMTGTEAISNGVSIFRDPQAKNARTTLVAMSTILGAMFLGISTLAAITHSVPFARGTPTVISEIGKLVYGSGVGGSVLFFLLQAATALILILAANTSYTGFPFLVSFVAEDSFLPRQLTERGHRLVFSNGIIVLTVAAIVLLVATRAKVASLIPMYAIGVFTGFTMAGAGMVKHHLRLRETQWRRSVVVNATAAVTCFVVVMVFAITEFTKGAWVVVVVMPLLVYGLVRLNKEYRAEDAVLEEGAAAAAAEAPILRRHAVVVMVDRLDLATARAIQYARALNPDDLRAVHFAVDQRKAQALIKRWGRLGLSQLPLDVIDTPDRRLGRAALELAADLADGQTEVSMLFPRRTYRQAWSRLLHDRTADRIIEIVSKLPHVNATIVPFNVDSSIDSKMTAAVLDKPQPPRRRGARRRPIEEERRAMPTVAGTVPISDLQWRQHARVAGRVRSVRIQPWAGTPALECSLVDSSGEVLTVVFLGRREVAGIRNGTKMVVDGVVGAHRGRLAMLNPVYELLEVPEAGEA